MGTKIKATSYFLPVNFLDNNMLSNEFPHISAPEIFRRSGVKNRHLANDDETPSDLAFRAAESLFLQHEDERHNINALIFCTEGLDYKAPASACILHDRLNLKASCLALDMPAGCTGFVNGLLVAKSLIGQNDINNVLLLTAEIPTRVIDSNDLHLRMLFGDGACATLITRSSKEKIGNFIFGTNGRGAKFLWVEHSGFRNPADSTWLEQNRHDPKQMKLGKMIMNGEEMLHFSLTHVPGLVKETLVANQVSEDDIDLFIFHQASDIILRSLRRKCRIPEEKFFLCLENTGNTVSSTIPLALNDAQKKGIIKSGNKVMLVSFGVGLSWAATIVEID